MLLEKHISKHPQSKVLVLFGGSPLRRDEIIRHLMVIEGLTIIGTLSEEEGMMTIGSLPSVDIVLIGGRYSTEQRRRIKLAIQKNHPHIKVTEPSFDYPYEESLILANIRNLMK